MMSFMTETSDGYVTGQSYTKVLTVERVFGSANKQHIVFQDEGGVKLVWTTSPQTKEYRAFRVRERWSFTIEGILNFPQLNVPPINIGDMKIVGLI